MVKVTIEVLRGVQVACVGTAIWIIMDTLIWNSTNDYWLLWCGMFGGAMMMQTMDRKEQARVQKVDG